MLVMLIARKHLSLLPASSCPLDKLGTKAAGPPVQLEPVDLSVKTPVVLQVPRYSPAAIITAAARRIPSPSTTPTPPPLSISTGEFRRILTTRACMLIVDRSAFFRFSLKKQKLHDLYPSTIRLTEATQKQLF
ncbi:hypothetical protein K0M31_013064 [Melipona bicolor]|uniref:Uncharacterized protein n=1 Tax=Melipona bicolor TaxID=60889 RepID=A0AA40FIC2_9HYME|nr:hypothetical protein K0M31_013064 [Melipona bicolor]